MKNKIITVLMITTGMFLISSHNASGQEILDGFSRPQEDSRKGKVYLLPEISLWFGSITNIEVAPQIAYHVSDRLSVGMGPHYIFYKSIEYYNTDVFTTHIWGAKVFSRYVLIKDAGDMLPVYLFDELFLHAEYERLSLENKYFNLQNPLDEGRFGLDSYYLGAGINQNFSPKGSYYLMILWNLNQELNSFYNNPMYRIGLNLYF